MTATDETREKELRDHLVVVDPSRYAALLISRRRLERVWNRSEWLHDLDTDEIFASQLEAKSHAASQGS
jgi:hypothetical protein